MSMPQPTSQTPDARPTCADVEAAAARLSGHVLQTPTIELTGLSDYCGCRLFAKLENLQRTSSFKERGALNKLTQLTAEQAKAGVIAMSAGNHAQGVAYHAARLGIAATIVMPDNTPFTKVARTKSFGARVILHGETLTQATSFAREMADKEGLIFVHPFDDAQVIAGQGTIALEMLMALDEPLDALIVPIGGGGLLSGIATVWRERQPTTQIIGVQSAEFPSMKQVIEGRPVQTGSSSLAEGIAVKEPGQLTRQIIADLVNDIIVVPDDLIEQAVYDLSQRAKVVAEGAGAAGLAAVLSDRKRFEDKRVGLVICGGNIDDRLYSNLLLRGMVKQQKIIQLRITLPDRPGALAAISTVIGNAGGNIVEVQHQRLFNAVSVKSTTIDIVMETRGPSHAEEIVGTLQAKGFPVRQLHQEQF